MRKRNVALIAAYKTIEEAFKAYRNRVKEAYGDEVDYMFKNGLRKESVIEAAYTDKDGVEHPTEERTEYVKDPNGYSMYSVIFDKGNPNWSNDEGYNRCFLQTQQNYFNNILSVRGHIFLNEVYEALGFDHTNAGAIMGWVLGSGNDYVDFGLFNTEQEKARDFINGYEKAIILDFNVTHVYGKI